MNVSEVIPWPELRQTSPTRKAKPSYKLPVYSINFYNTFPGTEFGALVKETQRGTVSPRALPVGHSWSQCYSANSPMPIRCARFATA